MRITKTKKVVEEYAFKQFILGIAGKKIEKEEYYKERTKILGKLKDV